MIHRAGIVAVILGILLTAGIAHAMNVEFAWEDSDPTVTGYKLYYRSASGPPYDGIDAREGLSPVDVHNVTTYTLTGLNPSAGYYFTVTAYNADSVESDYAPVLSLSPFGVHKATINLQ